jgi:hypothetical protein
MALLEIDQDELRLLDRVNGNGGWVPSVFLRQRVEKAVEGAMAQGAEVLVIEGDVLDPHDQISAPLRY